MIIHIEKVSNGWIVDAREKPEVSPKIWVFATLESALSFIKKHFGEHEE